MIERFSKVDPRKLTKSKMNPRTLPELQPLMKLPVTAVTTNPEIQVVFTQFDGVRLIKEPSGVDRQRFEAAGGQLLQHDHQWYLVFGERKGTATVPIDQVPDHLSTDGQIIAIRPEYQDSITQDNVRFANLLLERTGQPIITPIVIPPELRAYLCTEKFMYFCGRHFDVLLAIEATDS